MAKFHGDSVPMDAILEYPNGDRAEGWPARCEEGARKNRQTTSRREVKMGDKKRCVQKAKELAVEYQQTLVGCGHSSFAAAIDALRSEGIELVTPEVEDEMFKGLIGLTGGVGNMGVGTCGAVIGAGFVISLASGIGRKELEPDKGNRWVSYYNVAEFLARKWITKNGGLSCRETQMTSFGKALNSRLPERSKELFETAKDKGCLTCEQCTIAEAAGLAVEAIWDMKENPRDLTWVKEKHEK
jgi:hypothetical protein